MSYQSNNGNFRKGKVKMNMNGQPTVTCWAKERTTKAGKIMYGGAVTLGGKLYGVSVIGGSHQTLIDRNGKEFTALPVKITLLNQTGQRVDI